MGNVSEMKWGEEILRCRRDQLTQAETVWLLKAISI